MAKTTKKFKLNLPKKIVFEINSTTLLTLIFVGIFLLLAYRFGLVGSLRLSTKVSPSFTKSPVPTSSPTRLPTPTPKKQYIAPKPTTVIPSPLPTIDPNKEIVRCTISPNCGGGFKEMTRESCQNTVCCKLDIFGSKWELRTNSECSQQQSSSAYQHCIDGCSVAWNSNVCEGWTDIDLNKKAECELEQSKQRQECMSRCSSSD